MHTHVPVPIGHPQFNAALRAPPHSTDLQLTRVPSIWPGTDGGHPSERYQPDPFVTDMSLSHRADAEEDVTEQPRHEPHELESLRLGDRLAHRRPHTRRRCQRPRLGSGVVLGVGLERGHGRWDGLTAVKQLARVAPHTRAQPLPHAGPERLVVQREHCGCGRGASRVGGGASDDDDG